MSAHIRNITKIVHLRNLCYIAHMRRHGNGLLINHFQMQKRKKEHTVWFRGLNDVGPPTEFGTMLLHVVMHADLNWCGSIGVHEHAEGLRTHKDSTSCQRLGTLGRCHSCRSCPHRAEPLPSPHCRVQAKASMVSKDMWSSWMITGQGCPLFLTFWTNTRGCRRGLLQNIWWKRRRGR